MSTFDSIISALLLALSAHLYCRRYEPRADSILAAAIVSSALLHNFLSLQSQLIFTFNLIVFLSVSIVGYRLSPWHPLAKFPGPRLARISKLWLLAHALKGKRHLVIDALHERYGSLVRVAPNDLSFLDARAAVVILGSKERLKRGKSYESFLPWDQSDLVFNNSPAEHARLRRIWDRALSASAVATYRAALTGRANQLVECLLEIDGPVDVEQWLGYLTMTIMGDLVFGGAFDLLGQKGDSANCWSTLKNQMRALYYLAHIPWTYGFLGWLPKPKPFAEADKVADESIAARKLRPNEGDILHYLLGEDQDKNPMRNPEQLRANTNLAMIGGADTTTTALSYAVYSLIANPDYYARLRAEVDEAFDINDTIDYAHLVMFPFLGACINEALRLMPPVLGSTGRIVGPGGVMIADHFVPANTNVGVSTWSAQRSPSNFSPAPDSFLPERWLADAEKILAARFDDPYLHDSNAFITFNGGMYLCAGKTFALLEMRITLAKLIHTLDMKLASPITPKDFEFGFSDIGVATRPPLHVIVNKRAT